jgi:hypothetical protein
MSDTIKTLNDIEKKFNKTKANQELSHVLKVQQYKTYLEQLNDLDENNKDVKTLNNEIKKEIEELNKKLAQQDTTPPSTASTSAAAAPAAASSTAPPASTADQNNKSNALAEAQSKLREELNDQNIKFIDNDKVKGSDKVTYKEILDYLNIIKLSDTSYTLNEGIAYTFTFPEDLQEDNDDNIKKRNNITEMYNEATKMDDKGKLSGTDKKINRQITTLGDFLELILVLLIPHQLTSQGDDNETIEKIKTNNINQRNLRKNILYAFAKAISNDFETAPQNNEMFVQVKYIEDMTTSLQALVEADIELADVINQIKEKDSSLTEQLNTLSQGFGELQGLILLERVQQTLEKKSDDKPKELGDLMSPLLDAVNQKIASVNNMLRKGLKRVVNKGTKYFQQFSNKYTKTVDPYYSKYLKYKSKYLALKNN